MRKKNGLVYGVGLNDYDGKVSVNGKSIKSYKTWQGMLMRCYDPNYQEKKPTYIGCLVADEWLSFSNFKKWYDANYPVDLVKELDIRFELDKDLLAGESKVYSPETCIFLPQRVNGFLTNSKSTNASGYTGVSWKESNNKLEVKIRDFETGKRKYLGCFTNIEDASKCYELARMVEAEKAKEYLRELGYPDTIIDKIK